eukprot:scaffold156584_cov19-Tisochrysis_lutea.AAC.1
MTQVPIPTNLYIGACPSRTRKSAPSKVHWKNWLQKKVVKRYEPYLHVLCKTDEEKSLCCAR